MKNIEKLRLLRDKIEAKKNKNNKIKAVTVETAKKQIPQIVKELLLAIETSIGEKSESKIALKIAELFSVGCDKNFFEGRKNAFVQLARFGVRNYLPEYAAIREKMELDKIEQSIKELPYATEKLTAEIERQKAGNPAIRVVKDKQGKEHFTALVPGVVFPVSQEQLKRNDLKKSVADKQRAEQAKKQTEIDNFRFNWGKAAEKFSDADIVEILAAKSK